MYFRKILDSFKQLRDTIAPMPFKEKIDHILTSYTDVVVIGAFIFILLAMTVSSLIFAEPGYSLSGAVMNVTISEEGKSYIADQFPTGLDDGSKHASLNQYDFIYVDLAPGATDFDTVEDLNNATATYQVFDTLLMLVSAQQLDCVFTNHESLAVITYQQFSLDLSTFFTQDEMEIYGDKLIYAEVEKDKPKVPVAVDISGTEFAKTFITEKTSCISLVANSKKLDNCRSLIQYIFNWTAQKDS